MKDRKDTNPSFMNGVAELLILQLLSRREMYGYGLVRAIRDETGEAISFGEGAVYPTLHALERRGLLTARRIEKDGRSRVYYRLTRAGRGRLSQVRNDWSQIAAAITRVLGAPYVPA